MKKLLFILIFLFAFNQVNGQHVRRVKEASKMTATDDTSGVDKTAGKMYVYDDKYWVGHGTGLRQMSTGVSASGVYVEIVDSTAANKGHYATFKALDDTADAHITKIEKRIIRADSTAPNEGHYATFKALDDTADAHIALIYARGDPGDVFTVGSSGCDYTTIAAALTACSGGETILVFPGIYDTTPLTFGCDSVAVVGMGRPENIILEQANIGVVFFQGYTGNSISNITIKLTAPSTAQKDIITVTTGSAEVRNCNLILTTAQDGDGTDQSRIAEVTGAGTLKIRRGSVTYQHTGNTTNGLKSAFYCAEGGSLELFKISNIDIDNSGTATISSIFTHATTGTILMEGCRADVDDDNATYTTGFGYTTGTATTLEFKYNTIAVHAADNNAYAVYVTDATLRFSHNHIHIETSGSGEEYSFIESGTGTINSHMDDIIAPSGKSGNIVMTSSEADGDFTNTGNVKAADYGSDGSVSDAELLYINTLSGNVEDALNARCLESVFGTSIGTGLVLDATVLKTQVGLQSIAGLTETNGGFPYGTADNAYAWLGAGAEGTLLMGNGIGAPSWLGAGTAGYFLIANGGADPVWTTQPTLVSLEGLILTNGDLIYATGADALAKLDHGTAGYVLQANGVGAPTWLNIVGNYQPLDLDLTALAGLSGSGLVTRTGANTYTERTITGTADEISVTNGDGVSGDPALSIDLNKDIVTTAPLTGGVDDVLVGADGDLTIAMPVATTSADGYLSQTDWDKFNEKSDIDWNEGLTVNETYEGHTASVTVGETVIFGQTLVLKADGEYYLTDADATTTMPCQVIALESKADGQACLVLIEGYICDTDWNWTLGDGQANTLYPDDTTPGAMVQHAAAPSDVGDQVQTVGRVITADTIFFRPSWDLTEVGS